MTEAIRTEHLKFSYDAQSESGGVMVFDDLNLSIEEGSFIAVLGHNGCGKSTLAKHFNAVLLPEGGNCATSASPQGSTRTTAAPSRGPSAWC